MTCLKSSCAAMFGVAVALLVACSGSSSTPADASQTPSTLRAGDLYPDGGCAGCGVPCAREADCGPGLVCGYNQQDGCDAKGVCVPRWPLIGNAACGALGQQCGCDGTVVVSGCNYFPGYVPAPVRPGDVSCLNDGGTSGGACAGFGASCGPSACCDGLGCSPPGAQAPLPGSCVPL